MPTEPLEHWIKIRPGNPLRDLRIIEVFASMKNEPPRLIIEPQLFYVRPGCGLAIRIGAFAACLFGWRDADVYSADAEDFTPHRCYRLGRRRFIWE